jgi:UDP-N-acetylmuramoyl-tripeptide--D-alanyl-D-alanine ligase
VLTLSAGRLAATTGGDVVYGSPDLMVNGFVIDSRQAIRGSAFVALPGEKVDGLGFVGAAFDAGARVAVVSHWDGEVARAQLEGRPGDHAVVLVADTAAALTALAAYHRSRLHCRVIGITGSTGKTSTKDFLAAALGARFRVVATKGNRNNELGVPLTLLDAGADTDVLVVEMGMRGPGQIESLCDLARPDAGLVTNIGQTHMELMGSQEAIVAAKGELVRCISADGAVFLNGDDSLTRELASASAASITWYGVTEGVDVRASDLEVDESGCPTVTLAAGEESARVRLPVPGRHNAYTAAAATAVALWMGVPLDDIAAALEQVTVSDMRMQVFTAANGVTVVNDAYNASPTSMRAAVAALADMKAEGSRIAVLGDMAELGTLSELAHFKLGEDVARSGIEALVTVGELARHIGDGARVAGMDADAVRACASVDEASEVLDDLARSGDIVLVKASRSVGLERVVEGILNPHA